MNTRRIFLHCQLSQGSFSGEVVFKVETVDSGTYIGAAPKDYCRTPSGEPFGPNELPGPNDFPDRMVDGKVATRLVANGGVIARVALPDGEAVKVAASLITQREAEISHVLV